MKQCRICLKEKSLIEFKKRKDTGKYRNACKKCISKRKKEYRKKNREKKLLTDAEYRKNNRDILRAKKKIYYEANKDRINKERRKRIKSTPILKLKKTVRCRFYSFYKKSGKLKPSKTLDVLGCDWEFYKKYIEDQFEDWMTWDNHGLKTWHIDHIIPLNTAETEEDLLKLFHYTNTRPLSASENYSRGKYGLDVERTPKVKG